MSDVRESLRDGFSADPRSASIFGPWRYAFAAAGPIFAVGGAFAALTGDRLLGVGVLLMGLGFGAVFMGEQSALEHSGATTEVLELGGVARHAVVFRQSPRRLTWFAGAAACGAAVGLIGLAAAPELAEEGDPTRIRIAAGVVGVVCAAAAAGLLRARTNNVIALTPEGLWARGFLGLVHIPWDEIVDVGLFNVPGQRGTRSVALGIGVRERSSIQDTKVLGVLSGFDRAVHGWDITFSVTTMGFDPRILAEAVDWYRRDPRARSNIGRPDELDRLKKMVP